MTPAPSRSRSASRAAIEGVVAFGLVLGLGIGVGWVLRLAFGRGPVDPDRAITDWFVARRSAGLTDGLRLFQPIGRGWVLAVVVAIGIALVVRGHHRTGVFLAVAAIGSELLVDITKAVVGRHRPPVRLHLDPITNGALPSGHAFNSTVVVGAVLVAIWHLRRRPLPLGVWSLAAGVPLTVGLTRVYLGVHWITDVVAGWTLGALWIFLLARACSGSVGPRGTVRSRAG